jgi:hypothetical protein
MISPIELLQLEKNKPIQAIRHLVLLLNRAIGRLPILNRLIEASMSLLDFITLTKIKEFMVLNMCRLQKLKI